MSSPALSLVRLARLAARPCHALSLQSSSSVTPAVAAASTPSPAAPKGATTSVARVVVAEEMNARFRATMEDAFVIIDGFGGDPATGFFGVYDGHGGACP